MFLIDSFKGNFGGQFFSPNAVTFGGSQHGSNNSPSGLSDSALGIVSFWIKVPSLPTSSQYVFSGRIESGDILQFGVVLDTSGIISVVGKNVTTTLLSISAADAVDVTLWNHFAFAWDLTTLSAEVSYGYKDGASSQTVTTRTGGSSINYTGSNNRYQVGAHRGSNKLIASVAELYVNLAETLDISNSTNLEKFRSSAGNPVYLGDDGSTPTGTAAAVYMKNPASTYNVNSGTMGNFTLTGTLTEASPPP